MILLYYTFILLLYPQGGGISYWQGRFLGKDRRKRPITDLHWALPILGLRFGAQRRAVIYCNTTE